MTNQLAPRTKNTSHPRSPAGSERTRRAKQSKFLDAFRNSKTVSGSVRITRTSRQTHRNWLATDPEYAERFQDVNDELTDELEQELRRRAMEGSEEPMYHKGERVGFRKRRSDACLVLLLKAKRPELFRDPADISNEIDHSPTAIDPSVLTNDELEMARTLARKAAGLDEEAEETS